MKDCVSPPGQLVNSVETPPPGQARYLRDVIRKYQEEEKEDRYPERHGTITKAQAPFPLTTAEKRLERLKTALLELCNECLPSESIWVGDIRKILEQSEKST